MRTGRRSFYQILTNQPGKDAWPITGATFIMMQLKQDKPQQAAASLKFFDWAYANGDKMADELDYVPLPDSVEALIRQAVGQDHRHCRQAGLHEVTRTPVAASAPSRDGRTVPGSCEAGSMSRAEETL